MLSSSLLSPPPYISLSNLSPLIAGRRGRRRRDRERNKQAGEAGNKGEKRITKGGEGEGGSLASRTCRQVGSAREKTKFKLRSVRIHKGHFSRKGRRTGMNRKVGKEGDRVLATCANAKWAILQRQKYFS